MDPDPIPELIKMAYFFAEKCHEYMKLFVIINTVYRPFFCKKFLLKKVGTKFMLARIQIRMKIIRIRNTG
jgi:hypothetical protein